MRVNLHMPNISGVKRLNHAGFVESDGWISTAN